MKVLTRAFTIWVAMIVIILPAMAETRGITAEDYFAFKFLNDVQLSPDGATVAFVVGTIDRKENRRWIAGDVFIDDLRAIVEQPALETGRKGNRVSVGTANPRRIDGRSAQDPGVDIAARRGRTAACDESAEWSHQFRVVAGWQPDRVCQPEWSERHDEVAK